MKKCFRLILIASLMLLCACPQDAGQRGGTAPAGGTGTGDESGSLEVPSPLDSPLAEVQWDGEVHELQLAEFCDLLIGEGAAALLGQADFSGFDFHTEFESSGTGNVPIGIWVLPEDTTPVGFEAQLVAFGEGERLIFGFNADWYERNFGLSLEELDEQFRALHEEHGGVLRNYAYRNPDYDISFFQFDFGNDDSGTWGSPYMTHKRFTMHGDSPAWNFYCIGVDAGATLATRQRFEEEAGRESGQWVSELPEGLDGSLQPDGLLLQAAAGGRQILDTLGIDPNSGEHIEGFSLMRVLRPRTRLMSYSGQVEEGYPQFELQLAEESEVRLLSFTDSWLEGRGIDNAAFVHRFLELQRRFDGWEGEENPAAGTVLRDSGVIIGSWELARREFSLGEGVTTNSWAIRPVAGAKDGGPGADPAGEG